MANTSELLNLSDDELLALATEVPENTGPQGTVVMARPREVAQVLETTPQPQVSAMPVPPPPTVETAERGRPRLTDPTNPAHILAIAKRAKSHAYYTGRDYLPGWSKRGAVEYARTLKSRGEPVNACIHWHGEEGEESQGFTLVFY